MDTDKTYAIAQALAALQPGPWTPFNPFNAGWSVLSPFTAAWAQYDPLRNRVQISMLANIKGASSTQVADGYVIATMPAQDADTDADGNPAPNGLLPQQTCTMHLETDALQSSTPGAPRMKIQTDGSLLIFGISTSGTVVSCDDSYTLDAM